MAFSALQRSTGSVPGKWRRPRFPLDGEGSETSSSYHINAGPTFPTTARMDNHRAPGSKGARAAATSSPWSSVVAAYVSSASPPRREALHLLLHATAGRRICPPRSPTAGKGVLAGAKENNCRSPLCRQGAQSADVEGGCRWRRSAGQRGRSSPAEESRLGRCAPGPAPPRAVCTSASPLAAMGGAGRLHRPGGGSSSMDPASRAPWILPAELHGSKHHHCRAPWDGGA
jgi:hypothetical protein